MEHQKSIENFTYSADSVVTLGKFDGVHRGHRKLLARVHEIARRRSLHAAVFTFSISPQIQLGERNSGLLMTNEERAVFLRERDVDLLLECPFTDEIRNMSAEEFVAEILVRKMRAKALVIGTDFHFGKNRAGNPRFLQECAQQYNFTVDIIQKEKDTETGRDISSTFIREMLEIGDMEKVNELLGYPFFVNGTIVHGRHLGHTLGFPTINQIPAPEKMLPPHGVYMSQTLVGGKVYQGISNIGVKPTVSGDSLGMETYLFDCSLDLYGQNARVELLHYHRPEQKFASIGELQERVHKDIADADDYFFPSPESRYLTFGQYL
ncbi:MAG: bifunctional riboflavin kinase/FAD synthetase [Eubacterium sp.]|nr:bifunctional riboflavin kinase/FAD synthetase [Eubacterium sp.]